LIFPLAHNALTAIFTAGVVLLLLVAARPRFTRLRLSDCLLVALVAGCAVLLWREAGNTGALNSSDPIPGVSPNDVITPLVTYLFIGFYAASRRPADAMDVGRHGCCPPWCPFSSM
jgi:hypothetical protein